MSLLRKSFRIFPPPPVGISVGKVQTKKKLSFLKKYKNTNKHSYIASEFLQGLLKWVNIIFLVRKIENQKISYHLPNFTTIYSKKMTKVRLLLIKVYNYPNLLLLKFLALQGKEYLVTLRHPHTHKTTQSQDYRYLFCQISKFLEDPMCFNETTASSKALTRERGCKYLSPDYSFQVA